MRDKYVKNTGGTKGLHIRKSKLESVSTGTSANQKKIDQEGLFEQYKAFFEQFIDSAIIYDPQSGQILQFNDQAYENLGYTRDEFQKLNITDIEIIETPQQITQRMSQVLKEGRDEFESKYRMKDGRLRDVLVRKKIISVRQYRLCLSIFRDIIRQKQVEKELEDSREHFKSIFQNTLVGIYRTTPDGRILLANPAIVKMLGYDSFEELEEINLQKKGFMPEHPRSDFLNLIEAEGKVMGFESIWCKKDGSTLFVRESAQAVRDKGGNTLYYEGTVEDITEQKKAEEKLKESEELIRLFLNATTDLAHLIDEDGIIIELNEAMSEALGFNREELIGKNVFDLFPPEQANRRKEIVKRVLRSNKPERVEDSGYNKWFDSSIYPIPCSKGEKRKIAVFTHNITEIKKAENELRNSEARYHSLFNNANGAIFLMDFDIFIECNNKTLEIYGCTREQIIGEKPYGIFSPEFQPDGRSSKEKALEKLELAQNGKPQVFEWHHCKYDGTLFDAEVCLNPIELSGKIYIQAVVRDITERKKADENIFKYQKQLKSLASQLTLTEEKERYRIATALHDQIGQYLAVSQIELTELLHSKVTKDVQKTLEKTNERLCHAIEQTRSLTCDLSSPVLRELGFEIAVAAWLEDEVQRKHEIKTEFQTDGLTKMLDDDICTLLFRSVRELLFNIIKHAHAEKVKVFVRTTGNHIQVKVEDDGVGFNPVEVAATAAIKTKFGLFSIRERLEYFGGNIEIDSAPGKGCRITLTAPLKK